MTQRSLFDEPIEFVDNRPVLLDCQRDVIPKLRAEFASGKRRVICQAPCGSGKSITAAENTRLAVEKGKRVLHITPRRRLVDQMIGHLDCFGIKAAPIMEGRMSWTSSVYCASRDTLLAMLKSGGELPRTDLIINDECHVPSTEVLWWYRKYCPEAYWIGLSATPISSAGDSLAPPYQGLVSMAKTSELLKIGRLCPVKVYNPDAVGRRRCKGQKVKPVGDPIAHWLKYAKGKPTVVFAATVNDSQQIVQRYLNAGITAEHIDARTPDEERDEVFERSRTGETKIVSNCGVLIMGVDLPWLVCCQILRGCNSLVLWMQSTGRIMRSFLGKTFGIVLDHAGCAHEFGLPDADYEWVLGEEGDNVRLNKPSKERKPITCLGCGLTFVGKPACPECGRVLSKAQRRSLGETINGDAVLTEFTGLQEQQVKADAMERLWKKCLYMARAKGGTLKMAAAMFRSSTKLGPWEAGLETALPQRGEWDTTAKDWLDSQATFP